MHLVNPPATLAAAIEQLAERTHQLDSARFDASNRLEALRVKLCAVGLHKGFHDTPEKAATAVVEMIAYFRNELANPPHDVQCLVLKRLGVEGYTEQALAKMKLVSL